MCLQPTHPTTQKDTTLYVFEYVLRLHLKVAPSDLVPVIQCSTIASVHDRCLLIRHLLPQQKWHTGCDFFVAYSIMYEADCCLLVLYRMH